MIGFYLFLGFEKLLMLLPHAWRKALFSGLATLAYHLDKKHRHVVRQNLQFVYGDDLDETLVEEVSRYGYRNLALNLLFTIERRYMSLEEFKKKLVFENLEHVEKVQAEGRPIIFCTAHFGQWELGGSAVGAFIEPVMAIYKGMNNPYFEKYLLESRAQSGMTNIPHHGAFKALIKQMRQKKSMAILIDTNIKKSDGIVADFMGKPTTQVTTPAYLARKLNAAVIPAVSYTEDNENFIIRFFPEIKIQKTDDEDADVREATQKLSDWLSEVIYDDPKQWFWMHRRWKTDYPEIYKEG